MPMEQSHQDQLGEAGQSAIVLFFNDLGWGPLTTGKHDLGTDVFVQVREELQTAEESHLVDLGMLLGVQVKTGDSWFSEPANRDGRSGWWFRERDHRHEEYWVNHHIPHILIMQTESRDVQVWARLDRDSIEDTGAGIRVFVPADQSIGRAAAQQWAGLVAEARKLQSFEGSRWSFNITQVPPSDWPRYALLASRIVAPHPNRGTANGINWAEAVALCIQATPERWLEASERGDGVPTPTEAEDSNEAGWRFAGAIYRWITGSGQGLQSLDPGEFSDELRVAHAICLALVAEEQDDYAGAAEVLRAKIRSDIKSVDQAWLQIQLGWVEFEVGKVDSARAAFSESVAMHAAFPSSLVNSAVRSAGILSLFESAPGLSGDVEAAVTAADNTLSWWQTQQVESALNPFLRRSFLAWARDKSISFGAADATHNELFGAELSARLIGNRRSSRYSAYLRAIANLALPSGDHTGPEEQLEVLRAGGYTNELSLAIHRFRAEGPLQVVATYMSSVNIHRVTTTSHAADLESLSSAGSYLTDASAREWVDYLFAELGDLPATMRRFNLQFPIEHKALEALGGLQLFFSAEDWHRLIAWALRLPGKASQLIENPLRALFQHVDLAVLGAELDVISSHIETLDADSWPRELWTNAVSSLDPQARAEISERIARGQIGLLPYGFRVDSLSDVEAATILTHCGSTLASYRGQTSSLGVGAPDVYMFAAQLAIYGPSSTREEAWGIVVPAIAAADVVQERKSNALAFLAHHTDRIPVAWVEPLRVAAEALQDVPPSVLGFFGAIAGLSEAGPHFKRLLLELSDENQGWERSLSALLTGTSLERREAIAVLSRRPGHELTLGALVRDLDREVAFDAAKGLARRVAEDATVCHQWLSELLSLVTRSGEQVAIHIGSGILDAPKRVPDVEPLIEALRQHESRQIRSIAHQLDDTN
ncbi:DUF4365 domain-containing protein [Leifsonia sp. NPDC056665]|uniref:DUF4365 domain-containing protein n=1 Tax=Leifsonia sp. NPDC056665 TaxID=3345901 RepID=UPI00369875A6